MAGPTAPHQTSAMPRSTRTGGLVYGVVQSTDILTVLDPVEHRASVIKIPSRGPRFSQMGENSLPSPYWGNADIWERASDPRSLAMDSKGRLWLTGRFRDVQDQPAFCQDSENAFGGYYPLVRSDRQVTMYDPASGNSGGRQRLVCGDRGERDRAGRTGIEPARVV